ncbi:ArsC/Spx/MgsR family protein [Xanthobacter pseudotagetidis]|uniref:ArsC/Spx/MgsR family protein n=1 Tax=Xanthobacter pseudotagetidis TaxID=3119911 RepID=UPI00372AAF9B
MAKVVFYEKPGCGTNARQRQILAAAGHELDVRSLLAEPWTAARLRAFFGATPVASWFNPASPRVKSGAVDPAATGAEAAIALMLADPLLIRRPLVEAEGVRCAGFDRAPVTDLLAVGTALPEACSRPGDAPRCPDPAR